MTIGGRNKISKKFEGERLPEQPPTVCGFKFAHELKTIGPLWTNPP